MKLRKIIPALFFCLFLFAVSASAKTLQFTIGDNYVTVQDHIGIDSSVIDAAPFISNGRTLVPVRVIAETFGSKVEWDDPTDTVTISSKNNVIKLVIGSKAANVNGKSVALDVPANIYDSRTFVPIRFVTESLGYNVSYVDMTKDVIITDLPAIMNINGTKVSMETYNLIKYLDEYDFDGKKSAELVEYSKSVYSRIETAYKKYAYVFAKGDRISEAKKKEILAKLDEAYLDEDFLNDIVYGVYASWEEKLAYAELYDEKYAPEKQQPVYDETVIANAYKADYYSVDYIKIPEKNQDNLKKILAADEVVVAEGFDAAVEKFASDEAFEIVKGKVLLNKDVENPIFEIAIDLDENGVSEAVILDDGYYIIRKTALPPMTEEIRAIVIEKVSDDAVKEVEDNLKNMPVEYIVTSDNALDLAE